MPKELRPDPGSNTESPEERPPSSALKRNSEQRPLKSNESVKSVRKPERAHVIHPLNFSVSDLQASPKLGKRNKKKKDDADTIPMKDLTLTRSPVRVHRNQRSEYDNSSTLKRVNDTARETSADTHGTDFNDLKFADETSDSSNEIKFADDSPDSNRLVDKYDVTA